MDRKERIMKLRHRSYTGALTPEVSPRETEHRKVARAAAGEGIVLLKNEGGVLPLKKGSRIALYGAGAVYTVKGGTGSGDVNARDSVSIRQGLENAGYRITSGAWLDSYEEIYRQAREDWKNIIFRAMTQPKYENNFFYAYSDHPFRVPCGKALDEEAARNDGADVAVFVLSRNAGEHADRRDSAGDYYLTNEEKALLDQITRVYHQTVVVINAGGLVDLSFTDGNPGITAIVQMVQGGQEGGSALADILSGDVTPSGKLTDTWTMQYQDYPNAEYFGIKYDDAWQAEYREGIYVGYRYFDTFRVPVRYGFGYGLSYTEFAIRTGKVGWDGSMISVDAEITNTGDRFSGKEVVQVYVSCPQGKLTKEFRRLCCFGKTRTLAPGQSERMTLSFRPDSLTSFDEAQAAWILEKGVYGIWVGNSLDSAKLAGSVLLDGDAVVMQCRHICPQKKGIEMLEPDPQMLADRQSAWMAEAESLPRAVIRAGDVPAEKADYAPVAIPEGDAARKIADSLTVDQLVAVSAGDIQRAQGALGAAGQTVPGAAAETVPILAEEPWNVASIVLADGPAGLRLKKNYQVHNGRAVTGSFLENLENGFFAEKKEKVGEDRYQFCTAIPVGTLLAQSWNLPMIREIGEMIGREMLEFEVTLWLAPGLNIHRNPLCGRNFEYYSEDPLLSGVVAAAMTQGVQSIPGCGTTIKHFACNNQEDKRMGSDSILSERTLREIYLKGFEIAVRTAQPMAIMTSYNMVNGVHTANSYDLCTMAARNEWGFAGLIMTDWTTTTNSLAGECTASGCMNAGNDLVMPGNEEDHADVRRALADGSLSLEQLRRCARNTIRICLLSNQYEDAVSYGGLFAGLRPVMKAE